MMRKDAKLSRDRRYRYALWRVWNEALPHVMFVGLNPSTADETVDDPTLVRCMGFAESWGYGGVVMSNLFAFRATDPADMKAAMDPVGRYNNRWLKSLASEAGIVVAAWGNDGAYLERSTAVKAMLPEMQYLKMNGSGEPAHPLYLRASLRPTKWI